MAFHSNTSGSLPCTITPTTTSSNGSSSPRWPSPLRNSKGFYRVAWQSADVSRPHHQESWTLSRASAFGTAMSGRLPSEIHRTWRTVCRKTSPSFMSKTSIRCLSLARPLQWLHHRLTPWMIYLILNHSITHKFTHRRVYAARPDSNARANALTFFIPTQIALGPR